MAKNKLGIMSSVTKFTPRQFKLVTQQMYLRNLELAQVNKTLSLLRTIDLLVLRPEETLKSLCANISSSIIKEYKETALVALYSNVTDKTKDMRLLGSSLAGNNEKDKRAVTKLLEQAVPPKSGSEPAQTFYKAKTEAELIALLLGMEVTGLQAVISSMHIEAFYISPLLSSGDTSGVLVIGLYQTDESQQTLLTRVGEAVSLATENKALQEENRNILHKLRTSNSRLKELDESKDEFISMASHQLRTPLTSIKGYVSMLLEGDVGKVTKEQRKVLEEAFNSSQRMVYLIGDFLNVSRLQTGKFELEFAEVDMARIINEEIDQLRANAASRKITLRYQAPSNFPFMSVDENKIRQVMMNFIDNAIYYSLPDTAIDISLTNHAGKVIFKVVDHGIGVPVKERHMLFTKFFRASNAKKQRPDGTGIGLFMAKKVIVAHGGSIIFESVVGKGSTFGFSLPLKKVDQPVDHDDKK